MQLSRKKLKFTELLRLINVSLLIVLFFSGQFLFSQGEHSDRKIKIDGVAAVVGDHIILDSDIDKALVEMESQGISTQDITRCQLLGKLMEDKLYVHNAIQDSLEVNNEEIYSYVERAIEHFTEQLGSIEKVLEFYNKTDEVSFKEALFELHKMQKLSSMMKSQIVEKVEITPEEVRRFFESIPKSELPTFGAELEISQIVVEPEVTKREEERIVNQLKTFREDILERGLSFSAKAILYSQDPGSRSNGGRYTLNRKRPRMVKEFRDVAFSLLEGEVSEPFKTNFGWHIIQMDKIRGQEIDIRHILLIPRIEATQLVEAKERISNIRNRIMNGEISFKEAARQFSDEKETRYNGGVLINPVTGDTRFELTNLDPVLYAQIRNLKDNEISAPLLEDTSSGIQKYKILMVSNRFDEHAADYSLDYVKIKELALKEKQLKTIQKWLAEKIDETYIHVNKDNHSCKFVNNWLKE